MRKTVTLPLATILMALLVASASHAWVRARMFDGNTPAGPNWAFLEKPAWEVQRSAYEEFRSGEPNGPAADKRFSWRAMLGGEQSDGKCDIRISLPDVDTVTSVLWEGCMITWGKNGYVPNEKGPQFYIRVPAGTLRIAYNNNAALGTRGWYCYSDGGKNGVRTGGGVVLWGAAGSEVYGIPVNHGIWHRVRVTVYPDRTWHVWVNDQQGDTNELWGTMGDLTSNRMIRWGVPDKTNKLTLFHTERFYWGQGEGEIDPIPGPGEAYDIGGVTAIQSFGTAIVSWYTEKPTVINKVYYGDTFHTLDHSADAVWMGDHWEAQLTDLDWNKTYTFYCESTDASGQEYDTPLSTFRTDELVLPYLSNGSFESGTDIYPWVDVYPPGPGSDDTQQWGRVYSDIDGITDKNTADVLPATGDPGGQARAFSGIKTGQSPFRKWSAVRQKVAVSPGHWYRATVKFQGWGNLPYGPGDMMGRVGLDPNAHDTPGTIEGEGFNSDTDVWWGQANAGIHGEYKTATTYAKATGPEMSVFLQTDFTLNNTGVRIAFDDATFDEYTGTVPTTCAGIRFLPSAGLPVDLKSVIVTDHREVITGPGMEARGYVEDATRCAGIRVICDANLWDPGLGVGSEVDVTGIVEINSDKELQVRAMSVTPAANPTGASVTPLALPARSVGGGRAGLQECVENGIGVNTTGLLVSASGLVTGVTATDENDNYSVFIDDGSGLTGGVTGLPDTYPGIEVAIPGALVWELLPGDFVPGRTFVTVVGNSSMKTWNLGTFPVQKPVVRVRTAADVVKVIP